MPVVYHIIIFIAGYFVPSRTAVLKEVHSKPFNLYLCQQF